MTDLVDRAQELEQRLRQDAIDRVRSHPPEPEEAPAARDCEECGEPIPANRLAAQHGATRCAFCQTLAEGRP